MKWTLATLIVLFALGAMAQQTTHSNQPANPPKAPSQEQPARIPDADNVNLDNPAVTMTLTVDSVTLPEGVRPLRPNELAYSVARWKEANDSSSGVPAQN